MPSFFRNAEDVRILFLSETDTPEKKRQYSRLKTIFTQCIRRSGARGSFFFHRRSPSLNNKPILILEPQGPVDRGIFQGGLTRFGETLSGTFHTPKPGHLVFETKKNISTSNITKFRREIRKLVASMTGMMSSGSDDRVQIITPAERARRAREQAAAKKQAATDARAKLEADRKARKEAREQRSTERDKRPLTPDEAAPPERSVEERVQQATREAAARQVVQTAGVAIVSEQLEGNLVSAHEHEGNQLLLTAERIEAEARVADFVEQESVINDLKYQLASIRDPDALETLLETVADDPHAEDLVAAITDADDPLAAAQAWVQKAQSVLRTARDARQPDRMRIREINQSQQAAQARAERARREDMRQHYVTLRAPLLDAQKAADAARRAGDAAGLEEAQRLIAVQQAALMVLTRLQRADDSMLQLTQGLTRLAERGETSAEDVRARLKRDSSLRHSASQLASESRALSEMGAAALVENLWQSRASIGWARSFVDSSLR